MGELYISKQVLQRLVSADEALNILDVRKSEAFASSAEMLPGAQWRDHQNVADWSGALDAAIPVIVYCVHGHEVSQGAADELRAQGYDARYLEGGIEDWIAAGYSTDSKSRNQQ